MLILPKQRNYWLEKGSKQFYIRFELVGKRGEIFDRNGKPLVLNVPGVIVYQVSNSVNLPDSVRRKYTIRLRRKVPRGRAVIIGYGLPYEASKYFEGEGFYVKYNWMRFYPLKGATKSLLGLVGRENYGLGGIEKFFDSYLKGKSGYIQYFRSGAKSGNDVRFYYFPWYPYKPPEDGKNLYLTIDRVLQSFAYEALKKKIEEEEANWGFVIITNPVNGEILAIADYPPSLFKERAVSDAYEPGSTFKIVLYSYLYSHHLISPDDTTTVNSRIFYIKDWAITDVHPMGKITYRDALVKSSNIVAARLALRLGNRELYETARLFGIGSPTGISLPAESPGYIKPIEKWTDVYRATFAYGYGVMVTGIQMAMIYGAVANGGWLIQPRIIRSDFNHGQPIYIRRILRKGVTDTLKEILREVVLRGTGVKARIEGVDIAGKTGTTKKIDPVTRRYSSKKSLVSFIGFFPVESPRYLIYVVIDEPKYGRFGGDVAAPVFREIAKRILARERGEAIQNGV